MIRCIVVDDEPLARQLLEFYIRQTPELSCVAVCQNAIEAYAMLQQQPVDLVFLDIQMPQINGLQFLKSLKQVPKIIFSTAHPNHAVEAFELNAVDYLLKPITFERFSMAVQKITRKNNPVSEEQGVTTNSYIFLKVNKRLLKIEYKDIIYAVSLGDYLKVYTPKQIHVSYMTLGKLETLLPEDKFVRIHRSTIINLEHIDYVQKNAVQIHGKNLPIGLTYKNALTQKLSTN